MREHESLGRKEKPVSQKSPGEYTAAELMRIARQNAGKTLKETGRDLQITSRHLSYVESGSRPVTKRLARQYEQLFNCEPGQIANTVFERPRKSNKRQ
jgi:transcriptional regulator with XRE-family HTH domain